MRRFDEMSQEYDKVSILARGGQKLVFSASHKDYGECVIKLYFSLNDPRSMREIEIGRSLNLDAVPKMYETGTVIYDNTETLYIVEEKICGTELRELLRQGMKFSLEEAVDFLEQGLYFIKNIESKGIVHRDIKPENIIRTTDGKIYFLDFGIARIINGTSLTKTEALMGPHTPGYAARVARRLGLLIGDEKAAVAPDEAAARHQLDLVVSAVLLHRAADRDQIILFHGMSSFSKLLSKQRPKSFAGAAFQIKQPA